MTAKLPYVLKKRLVINHNRTVLAKLASLTFTTPATEYSVLVCGWRLVPLQAVIPLPLISLCVCGRVAPGTKTQTRYTSSWKGGTTWRRALHKHAELVEIYNINLSLSQKCLIVYVHGNYHTSPPAWGRAKVQHCAFSTSAPDRLCAPATLARNAGGDKNPPEYEKMEIWRSQHNLHSAKMFSFTK